MLNRLVRCDMLCDALCDMGCNMVCDMSKGQQNSMVHLLLDIRSMLGISVDS